ncbi:unnamed protein product [Trifolium pratense]|uniref:Uncharacterized protein n=1 Tax=Trifolium pratense TaxID=57577 RepID=A0ACB0KJZ8_TRIPR|nr:unnamed protein product [Trifolium pratense]
MVSSPRFRSPRIRPASAIVPVPENSSIAYHKEVYTVLFDPPSFLMVHSIFCHLWKKSKMEKKFSPLPPLLKPLQQLPMNFAITSTMDEDLDSEILEKNNSEFTFDSFSFGNFRSEIVPIKSIKPVKPRFNGCIIKIGEISCFLNNFTPEEHHGSASSFLFPISEIKDELMKFPNASNASSTTNLESVFVVSESVTELNGSFQESMDLVVQNPHRGYFGIAVKNHSISSFAGHLLEGTVLLDLDLVSIQMCSLLHRINNTIFAVETVFDPGGVVKPLPDMITLISFSPSTFCLIMVFVVEFLGEFAVIVFDPGGNRHLSQLKSLTAIFISEEKHTKVRDSKSSLFIIDSELNLASEHNLPSELNLASGTNSDTSLFLIQLHTFASISYVIGFYCSLEFGISSIILEFFGSNSKN